MEYWETVVLKKYTETRVYITNPIRKMREVFIIKLIEQQIPNEGPARNRSPQLITQVDTAGRDL